jgi:shikimate kinase
MVRDTLEPPSQALSMRGEDLAVLGNGNAHGACSLLHAAGLGYGASIALDLPVAVRLLDSPSKRDLDDPDELLDQVLAAWTAAGHELPEGKPAEAFHWAVASKIPPRQGLKSSAAIAVAALRALADATSTDLETAEIVTMAAQAQIDAGVSLTGSIDDAWACAANGWKLIDPQAESIQEGVLLESPGPLPDDWYVLLVCRGDRERKPELEDFVPHAGAFQQALSALQEGRELVALTWNGRAMLSVLGDMLGRKLTNDALLNGARAAGITGSGSALVVVAPKVSKPTCERLKRFFESRNDGTTVIVTSFLSGLEEE